MPTLPLNELQITEKDPKTGKLRAVPALHPDQKADRCFVLYKPPPADNSPAQVDEYLERAAFIADDLDWLLALPHNKFWCQVIFDESLQKCLDSYLRYTPRKFDELAGPPSAVGEMQQRLHRSVFLTFLRMSTHKESKDHFISPCAFGEILYNNFLFDIPKMLDLCVLFGKGNQPLLQKMIENIFIQQPSYYSDLDETVPTILQVFSNILQQCGLQSEGASSEPQKLEEKVRMTPGAMPLQELRDVVLYLCDTATTLWAFLDVFPLACQTFQKHDFCSRLASFYEASIPELEAAIKKRRREDSKLLADLWQRLSHSRKKLVEVFHILIYQICLLPILESSCDNIQPFIEDFLQLFSSVLQEKRFLRDYDELFPVAEDVSLLQQASSALDETRTAYILQAVEGAWEGVDRRKAAVVKDSPPSKAPEQPAGPEPGSVAAPTHLKMEEEEECAGAAAATPAPRISGVELDSLISQVKDLLPDLGEGFILACLEHYDYSAEQVINNILEEGLAPALSSLDRSLNRQMQPSPTPLVSSRHNVFQNDEFDVFSRDTVDLSRVQKGRRKGEDTRSLLNDKRAVQEQRQRYSQYSVVVDEVTVAAGGPEALLGRDDYEDEYDDTYDGNQVGANDADSDDELITRRPFTTPQVLRTKVPHEGLEEEEEEEEEEAEEEGPKPDHFVQDPAVLRERAEAQRMAYLARKGYRYDGSSAVTGNPRGHGQSRETTQERRRKEANKGARANHNRRLMADRKRTKGMIPS
ncbi:activating signal cointegrator 1 complex subunit 2 [Antechinus flavipes]|uniref:activating signal cointegrator 1 complex subunit 2 n=1 Tax=Antechinus flavipes TaxID=38775 RepID=UPI002236560F|nr:activating signal cointegrator 1 complex subunit 2 [Antechinus flavipes]XP_051829045.1 activating signal cointegrator 1 complex subunit 2 [Antechinus flavipes]